MDKWTWRTLDASSGRGGARRVEIWDASGFG